MSAGDESAFGNLFNEEAETPTASSSSSSSSPFAAASAETGASTSSIDNTTANSGGSELSNKNLYSYYFNPKEAKNHPHRQRSGFVGLENQ